MGNFDQGSNSGDPMIGQAIGRYIIRSKLAEGGMGAVYVAVHERLNAKKVVKVLLAEYSRNEAIRQRFEREALAASRLKHRNIISIDDFGALPDGQLFLMMPFLDGKPLDAHIQQSGKLTQHHTLHILVQVCRALEHLHGAGLVHRDLKPGNIFITHTDDNPYEVTLIDLGIARDLAEQSTNFKTQTGMSMGTPGYMAVEQYIDAGAASPAADLYAVGVIAWEMLTGVMPWGVHQPGVLYHLQLTETPQPPPDHALSHDLLALLRHVLSPRPQDRPPSPRAFAVAFASITPALPPHVPSGVEILARYAKEFVERAPPTGETVRDIMRSDPSAAAPNLWPHRATGQTGSSSVPGAAAAATPVAVYSNLTGNDRPQDVPAPHTTVSGANGVTAAHTAPKRTMLVAMGLGGAALAGIVTFAVLQLRQESEPPSNTRDTVHSASDSGDAAIAPADAASVVAAPIQIDAGVVHVDAAVGVVSAPDAGTPAKATKATTRVKKTATESPSSKNSGSASVRGSAAFDPNAVEE